MDPLGKKRRLSWPAKGRHESSCHHMYQAVEFLSQKTQPSSSKSSRLFASLLCLVGFKGKPKGKNRFEPFWGTRYYFRKRRPTQKAFVRERDIALRPLRAGPLAPRRLEPPGGSSLTSRQVDWLKKQVFKKKEKNNLFVCN